MQYVQLDPRCDLTYGIYFSVDSVHYHNLKLLFKMTVWSQASIYVVEYLAFVLLTAHVPTKMYVAYHYEL